MKPPRRDALDFEQDARLVERCLAGDGRAWEALVSRHERLVYAVARGYRLSQSDLGDVFQEVFAALVKGLPRLRDGRTLCRWLARTTDRIARTAALRTRREQARTLESSRAVEQLADERASAGADLETIEEQARIRLAVASLPERCRRLLTALYYEDPVPSYAQLARRWSVPIGHLGPTRARCLDRLRRMIEQEPAPRSGISRAGEPTSSGGQGDDGATRGAQRPECMTRGAPAPTRPEGAA